MYMHLYVTQHKDSQEERGRERRREREEEKRERERKRDHRKGAGISDHPVAYRVMSLLVGVEFSPSAENICFLSCYMLWC